VKWIVLLLALAGYAAPVLGCLGESEAELDRRYGQQTKTGTSELPGVTIRGYNCNGFLVVVGMLHGHSAFEMYSKKDKTKITPGELTALMNANAGGRKWAVDPATTTTTAKWVLDDGSVVADWDKGSGSQLTVMTKEAANLSTTKKQAKRP
jgi:hypothetical protein